jgi:hypothetical protein
MNWDIARDTLSIDETKVSFMKVDFTVTGEVASVSGDPRFDLLVTSQDLDAHDLSTAIPVELWDPLRGINLEGSLGLAVTATGKFGDPYAVRVEGSLDLSAVEVSVASWPWFRPSLDGSITVTERVLSTENLELSQSDSKGLLSAKIENYLTVAPAVECSARFSNLNLDNLLQRTASRWGEGFLTPAYAAQRRYQGEYASPILARASVDARIAADRLTYYGIELTELDIDGALRDARVIVRKLEGYIGDGWLRAGGAVDLRGRDHELTVIGNRIEINRFITPLFPYLSENIFGLLSLNAELQGTGATDRAIKATLTGNGEVEITSAYLIGLNKLNPLASFLEMEGSDSLDIDQAFARFTVENGKIETEGAVRNPVFELYPKGTIDLNSQINLLIDAKISPEATSKLDLLSFLEPLQDEQGWIAVPLEVKGPVSSPRLIIPPRFMNTMKEAVSQLVLQALFKQDEEGAEKKPGQELLEEMLENALGE